MKRTRDISCMLMGVLMLSGTPLSAQQADSIHIHRIENSLRPVFILPGHTYETSIPAMMKKDGVPGVNIAFMDSGRVAWTKCYGYANREDSVKVNAGTVFLAASLSKPVAAIASLRMVGQGKLKLDEDVNQRLVSWKVPTDTFTRTGKVTLRQLITHRSGITLELRGFRGYDRGERVPTTAQLLKGGYPSKDSAVYVEFVPGTRDRYSNAGYVVMQQLMEDVSGKPFAKLAQELVLGPAGMTESSFIQPPPARLRKRRAVGYSGEGKAFPLRVYPFMAPASLWSTPTDLAKFMMTLLKDYNGEGQTLLSRAMAARIFEKKDERFVFNKITWGKDVLFRHTGSNDGFTCYMAGYVNKQQGFVIMTNGAGGEDLIEAVERAIAVEYNWEYMKPELLAAYTGKLDHLNDFAGNYEWEEDSLRFSVVSDKLQLTAKATEGRAVELIPVADTAFLLPAVPLKFTFLKHPAGKVTKIQVVNEHADYSEAVRKD